MSKLNALREKIAAKMSELEAVIAASAEAGEGMTAEQAASFAATKTEIENLEATLKAAEDVERRKAALAQPVSSGLRSTVPAQPRAAADQGGKIGRFVRAIAAGKGIAREAAHYADSVFGDAEIAAALGTQTGVSGGFLVPEAISTDFIELLRPASAVMQLNPTLIDMPQRNLTLNGFNNGASASYIAEQADIAKTAPDLRQVKLVAKKLAALVPVSKELLGSASVSVDRIVQEDLIAAIAQRSDLALIRGDGAQDTPIGLRNLALSANIIAANATVNLVNTRTDVGKIILALKNANVQMRRPGWIMAPRTEQYLLNLADTAGNLVYANEMTTRKTWQGFPYALTTQIPTNLGGGSDESELYLVDFAHFVIGQVPGIRIETSDSAGYVDNGNQRNAYSRDEVVIKAVVEHDCGLRHAAAAAVLTGVKWA